MRGNPNPSPATRFVPGQSGNPGGHHRSEKGFREMCREALKVGLPILTAMLGDMTPGQFIEAMGFLAKWSGYVSGDVLLNSEVSRLRAVMDVLMTDTLTKEQRDAIRADYAKRETEIAGEMAA